jgi:trigger factor
MSVVVSVQDVGPCRKQLTVEVPAPAVEAETQRVVHDFGQRVKIPGFRKGKVPTELVRRRFQKDIEHEVVDRLLPRYWRQAQAESGLDPLLPPEVDDVADLAPGSPFTFVATVEVRPQIELRNIRDFDLPNPPVDPGTMEIDDAVEDLRRRLGSWAPVERAAARGDLVVGHVTELGAADGGETPAEPQRIEVELGDERVWEELTLALSGLSAGQEAPFSHRDRSEEGAGGGVEGEEGRERRFRVRLESVQERVLPPLDDELVAKIAPELGTVDALRADITKRLRAAKEQQRREKRQQALLDQLRERHPLELPQGVVHKEVEGLVHDYAHSLSHRGIDVQNADIDWAQIGREMQPLAERRVHSRLLLDAIADSESVALDESEFEAALAAHARAQNTSTPALRRSLDENGRLAPLRAQMRRDKTIRHLLGEEASASAAAGA